MFRTLSSQSWRPRRTNRGIARATALTAVLATAVVAAGCGGDSGSDTSSTAEASQSTQKTGLKFAVVTHGNAGSSSFWAVFKKGAEQAADEMGVDLSYAEADNDPQKQAQMVDAAIAQKVDGIAVSAPNGDALKAPLEKARNAGIPIVITQASPDGYFREVGAITRVGQDELITGRAVGERIKSLGAKKVLCIIHEEGNIGLNDRCSAIKAGFGGTVDNLQVKGTNDLSTTLTEIQSKLQSDDSYDFVMALDTSIATASVDAIKGADSSARLGSYDLSTDVLKAIQAGTIEFTVDQQQYLQGYLPVVFLKLFNTNANAVGGGESVLTGPSFVDKANADTVSELVESGTR